MQNLVTVALNRVVGANARAREPHAQSYKTAFFSGFTSDQICEGLNGDLTLAADSFPGRNLQARLTRLCHSCLVSAGLHPDTLQASSDLRDFEVVMF